MRIICTMGFDLTARTYLLLPKTHPGEHEPTEPAIMKLAPLPSPRCTRSRDSGRARLSRGGRGISIRKKYKEILKCLNAGAGRPC